VSEPRARAAFAVVDLMLEAGWLERRTADGAWFWTDEAETALHLQTLRRNDPADAN